MFKLFALGLIVAIGAWVTGALGGGSYSRNVDRPQSEVMSALSDLDITEQPGEPGSTAAAAGGIKPLFKLERFDDHMTWKVMSGDKIATTMTATFIPSADGKSTRVEASVQRGDAPDDFVSPAFRSKGLTMALFGVALEGELNKLTSPPTDAAACARLQEDFESGGMAARAGVGITASQPQNLTQAIGGTAKTVMALNAYDAERRRLGCPDHSNEPFKEVDNRLGEGDGGNSGSRTNIDPSSTKPMVDLSKQ